MGVAQVGAASSQPLAASDAERAATGGELSRRVVTRRNGNSTGLMYQGKRISLVMPCLNEEQGLQQIFRDLPSLFDQGVVVDNGSTANTAAVARQHGATVIHQPQRGYGLAYKSGLRAATGDVLVTMDGDGTYPRNFIPVLLDVMFDEDLDF